MLQELRIFFYPPTHPGFTLDGAGSRWFSLEIFGLRSETLLRGSAGDTKRLDEGGPGHWGCLEWLVEAEPGPRAASGRI